MCVCVCGGAPCELAHEEGRAGSGGCGYSAVTMDQRAEVPSVPTSLAMTLNTRAQALVGVAQLCARERRCNRKAADAGGEQHLGNAGIRATTYGAQTLAGNHSRLLLCETAFLAARDVQQDWCRMES